MIALFLSHDLIIWHSFLIKRKRKLSIWSRILTLFQWSLINSLFERRHFIDKIFFLRGFVAKWIKILKKWSSSVVENVKMPVIEETEGISDNFLAEWCIFGNFSTHRPPSAWNKVKCLIAYHVMDMLQCCRWMEIKCTFCINFLRSPPQMTICSRAHNKNENVPISFLRNLCTLRSHNSLWIVWKEERREKNVVASVLWKQFADKIAILPS